MAETERPFTTLQTLLADNTTKAISPQDLRDAIVSALGGYASIYVDANTTAQAITATPAKLAAFASAGPARGATGDVANDKLTAGVAGDYLLVCRLSLSANTPTELDAALFKGGVALGGFAARAAVGTDVVNLTISGLASLALADEVDLRLSCSPNASVTVRAAHLALKRIG